MIIRTAGLVTLLGLLSATFGCSDGTPTTSDARQILEDSIAQQSDGHIQLVDFSKTTGQEREALGVKLYALEWKGTIEFTGENLWWSGESLGNIRFNTVVADMDTVPPFHQVSFKQRYSSVDNGATADLSGVFSFEQTEDGWRLRDLRAELESFSSEGGKSSSQGDGANGNEEYVEAVKLDLQNVMTAFEGFYANHGEYPESLAAIDYQSVSPNVQIVGGRQPSGGYALGARYQGVGEVFCVDNSDGGSATIERSKVAETPEDCLPE